MAPNSDPGLQWGAELLRERLLEKVTFKLRSSYRVGATKGMESSGGRSALGEHIYQTWKVRRTNTCWLAHESRGQRSERKAGSDHEKRCLHTGQACSSHRATDRLLICCAVPTRHLHSPCPTSLKSCLKVHPPSVPHLKLQLLLSRGLITSLVHLLWSLLTVSSL